MFKHLLFLLAFFVAFLGLNWVNAPNAIAQSTQEPASPDTGTPEGQQGVGGARPETSCPETGDKHLTALVQGHGQDLTRSANPAIWVYIPYSPENISYLEFSLHDRALTQTFYRTAIEVMDSPGLIKIPISYTLEPNETYRWYFKLYCQPHQPGGNTKYYYLQNWIQHQPEASAEASWYDRLTETGDRHFSNRDNPQIQAEWNRLLTSLDFPDWLWQEPFVNSIVVPPDPRN